MKALCWCPIASFVGAWLTLSACAHAQPAPVAPDYASAYEYSAAGGIDLGVQPMAYPLTYLSVVMQHDRLLKKQLASTDTRLLVHPFKRGPDVASMMVADKIEAGFLGDMPTIDTIIRIPTVMVGLAKRNFSSVVARDYTRIEQLRGKRIAYSAGTNSHHTLLQGLAAANMSEKDVVLVPMDPAAMPAALLKRQIDAFSAWEPTPTIALGQDKRNRAIFKGMSTAWFIFSARFAEQQPKQALQLVAAYVRATNWLRASAKNIELATNWVLAESERFSGSPPALTRQQAIALLRNDFLDVPGAPVVLDRSDVAPPLFAELSFLQAQGKIPLAVEVGVLRKAFAYKGLEDVMKAPKAYRTYEFDYAD